MKLEAGELRRRTAEELKGEILALRREQFNLRMQASGGEFTATHRIREVRRDIARVKTVLREKRV